MRREQRKVNAVAILGGAQRSQMAFREGRLFGTPSHLVFSCLRFRQHSFVPGRSGLRCGSAR